MEEWVSQLQQMAAGALRPVDGKLNLDGLKQEVEIITDRAGCPHVYASETDDLYFAQGYLHATERLWQIDFTRRVALGRLAEILGEVVLPLDRFFRTIGINRMVRAGTPNVDPITEQIVRPYHAGFSAGIDSQPYPVEYQFLSLEPDFPADRDQGETIFAIGLLMSFLLSPNWDLELLRSWLTAAVGPERARLLSAFAQPGSPSTIVGTGQFPGMVKILLDAANAAGKGPGIGSNNWVVSGSRTTTGMPILCNDPHLKIQMPGIWMQMHLTGPDIDATGVTLPGVPGVAIGHNRHIAWGFTNTQADIIDLRLERLSDEGTHYEFEEESRPLEVIDEPILVRHESEPRPFEVKATRNGPLIHSTVVGTINPEVKEDAIGQAMSLRWLQAELPFSLESSYLLNRAGNWEQFREAAAAWPIAGQNMVYADVDGNIGYQLTGTVPKRSMIGTGATPTPGWNSEADWQGSVPFEELPSAFNPETGFIATANNKMVDNDYPYIITGDWEPPHRINRIVALLSDKEKMSVQDMIDIQLDTHSSIAEALMPLLLGATLEEPVNHPARKTIQEWDLRMDADSAGALVFAVWASRVAANLFRAKLGDELFEVYFSKRGWTTLWGFDAMTEILINPSANWVGGDGTDNHAAADGLIARSFTEAIGEIEKLVGDRPDGWRWGAVHRLHLQHSLASAMPPLADLLSWGPVESPGADDTINRGVFNPQENYNSSAISSYRQIIDLADFDRSLGILPGGNSGNPASPHYKDQADLWLKGEYLPLPFSRAAVEENAEGRLFLEP